MKLPCSDQTDRFGLNLKVCFLCSTGDVIDHYSGQRLEITEVRNRVSNNRKGF